ncbi:VOC family protein [Arthrobacter celericrescens]|uniref:VOC family protein n=1 Tax=Arthrobacter celericrescens TaxID=2320851 RepID=UPI000EA2118E|nr:VOC family protein [Arthrobacter celericrescens]
MLRVRPIVFTSRPEAWEPLLAALGMIKTVDDGGRREFDAGSGRLALQQVSPGAAEDGSTVFGVEIGDPAEFARRTVADGTRADVVDTPHGATVQVTAEDGFSFFADKAAHGAVCADADTALAVVGVWLTPGVERAAQELRNIGARPRRETPDGADFNAKNGGVLAVRAGDRPAGGGLECEYDGELDGLRERLASAGVAVRSEDGVLLLATPDGGELVVRRA